jgi:Rhodopirellula transposase DDE domain
VCSRCPPAACTELEVDPKVGHRLFCHITQTWRGKAQTSRLAVVELIAATTTTTDLKVHCELDPRSYPKGIKLTNDEMSSPNITGDKFHPEWNYSIAPKSADLKRLLFCVA